MRVNSTVCTTNSRHLDTTAQAVHKHVGHRHRRHTHGHSTTQRTSAVDASVADTLYQHLDADPLIPAMHTAAMANDKVTRDAAAKLEPQARRTRRDRPAWCTNCCGRCHTTQPLHSRCLHVHFTKDQQVSLWINVASHSHSHSRTATQPHSHTATRPQPQPHCRTHHESCCTGCSSGLRQHRNRSLRCHAP